MFDSLKPTQFLSQNREPGLGYPDEESQVMLNLSCYGQTLPPVCLLSGSVSDAT